MTINGRTQLIGFFGSTYQTSKMYALYNAAFEALGLNFVYVPFAVEDLGKAVEGIRHLGISAVGVTIPYKIDIIPYLDELDDNARRIGAVSVVVNHNGRLIGGNTDGQGAARALQQVTDVPGKQVTILGAGGSARAIAFAVSDAGGFVTLVNRTAEKAAELAQAVCGQSAALDTLPTLLAETDILINTTPVGMTNTPEAGRSPLLAEWLRPETAVMDIITNPKETKLLQDARQRGCQIVYGERMLLWQGVSKFKLYTGIEPPIEVMEQALVRTE